MKTRKLGVVIVLCVFFVMVSACSLGKTPVLTYDGSFQLKVGRTTVGDALKAGFTGNDSLPNSVVGGKVESLYAYKDGIYYGAMRVANKTASPIKFENGVVYEVVIVYNDPSITVGEILINGVNYENYTREQVKEAMGTDNRPQEGEGGLVYEIGKYKYTFRFDDDSETVTSILINDGTKVKVVLN